MKDERKNLVSRSSSGLLLMARNKPEGKKRKRSFLLEAWKVGVGSMCLVDLE
jgi:hypothetical protein